ncbi:MAG: Sporulation sigma-E factor-processing peptidase [Lachnoclostridium sp.]|jgi:stage II sporulation protein GA (sporulation sigma-E factor processing peptidase)
MEAGVDLYLEVYIDVVFIINFIMDFLLLWIVKKILKYKCCVFRIVAGACIGAIGACILSSVPELNGFVQFLFAYVVLCLAMNLTVYGYKSFKTLLKASLILYITTFFLGGVINSLYYHSMIGYYFNEIIQGRLFQNLNLAFFLLAISAGTGVIIFFIKILRNLHNSQLRIYETELLHGDQSIRIMGLLDTGNNLYDPIYGKPVIITEYSALEPLLTVKQRDLLKKMMDTLDGRHTLINENGIGPESVSEEKEDHFNIMLIPYHSIGRKNGILPAIVMNRVVITNGKEKIYSEKVITAISRDKLSKNNEYQVILHRGVM